MSERMRTDDLLAAIRRGDKTPDMIVGEQVRIAREKAGVTLRELARVIGVSAPFLSDVEHGRRHLTTERLDAVILALGIDRADLERVASICQRCHGTGLRGGGR